MAIRDTAGDNSTSAAKRDVDPKSITVLGAGYVGLVTGACLAAAGHHVTVLEVDESKLVALRAGVVPFHEPGLGDIITSAAAGGRLTFDSVSSGTPLGEFIFIAVGTPSAVGGSADLRYVRSAVEDISRRAAAGSIVVMKSTVPPGTGASISGQLSGSGIGYVSNPEFLREGCAVTDWFQTDRIVLGGDAQAVDAVASLYANIEAPILRCDIASAELIKYASNAFLATKISFANEIAHLCDTMGADVNTVTDGLGMDHRIGPAFLRAGIGYGGSCFPKDTRALEFLSSLNGYDFHLLKAVIDVNARQRMLPFIAIRKALGHLENVKVAVLGLTFKPNTDDVRESPARDIIRMFLAEGATVAAYDPIGDLDLEAPGYVRAGSVEAAVRDAAAVVVATEWDEFVSADWASLVPLMSGQRLVFDGRNCLPVAALRAAGADYHGVGRR